MARKQPNEDGSITCPRCGEDKQPDEFNRGDSYCILCRRAYAKDYHARRRTEDPMYLAQKAARAKKKYQEDPRARVARLESARKYRTKQRTETTKKRKIVDDKWSELQ